jgi:hypothetical protein
LVAAEGTAPPFDLKLTLEMPSEDHCAQSNTMVAPALGRHSGAVAYVGCWTERISKHASQDGLSARVAEFPDEAKPCSDRLDVSFSTTIHNDSKGPI